MGADVYRRGYGELSVYVAAGQTGQAGEVKLIGREDDAGRAESGGATGMRSAMQYSEPERPLEPKDYDLPVCPVCGEETETYYKNKDGVIAGCEFCIETVDAWEEQK
jgi:hypothetical protein